MKGICITSVDINLLRGAAYTTMQKQKQLVYEEAAKPNGGDFHEIVSRVELYKSLRRFHKLLCGKCGTVDIVQT